MISNVRTNRVYGGDTTASTEMSVGMIEEEEISATFSAFEVSVNVDLVGKARSMCRIL